jgi:hypothetical protein
VKPWKHVDHIVMNLPASALDFLGKHTVIETSEEYRKNVVSKDAYLYSKHMRGLYEIPEQDSFRRCISYRKHVCFATEEIIHFEIVYLYTGSLR